METLGAILGIILYNCDMKYVKPSSLLYPVQTLKTIRDNFVEEIRESLKGKKTSLAFIKNPLPQPKKIGLGDIIQVVSIGGTIGETAAVDRSQGTVILSHMKKVSLPRFNDKKTFFTFFEKQLDRKTNTVGLNFAYALKPFVREGHLDGILVETSKEHKLSNLIGRALGEELEKYIYQKHKRIIKVTCANDTICLLLSCLEQDNYLSLACGIVGTGTNFAFFLDKTIMVNLESGNFAKFPQTETGKIIDNKSQSPRSFLFEKEVSGAYLFQHFNLLIDKISRPISSTLELSNLAKKKEGSKSLIAEKLLERSASLIACQIAGIYYFKKQPRLTFVMEGSLFWKGWKYKQMVQKYLQKLSISESAINFLKIKNSSLLGAVRLLTA